MGPSNYYRAVVELIEEQRPAGDLAVVGILMSAVESMGAGNFNSALDQGLAMAPKTIKEESSESQTPVSLPVAHDAHIKLVSADCFRHRCSFHTWSFSAQVAVYMHSERNIHCLLYSYSNL